MVQTPKTLKQAILNGFKAAGMSTPNDTELNIIALDIKDYLAQNFTASACKHIDVDVLFLELFNQIMNDKVEI